jgi:hypothetical protein
MVRGIGALFIIVLFGMSVLRSQSVRQKAAESSEAREDGRVAIFFGERGPSAPSAAPPSVRPDAPAVAESAGAAAALAVAPAPARAEAAFKSTQNAMAPAGPAAALQAARAPLAWDVTVAEAYARGWALRRVAALPPSADTAAISYRVKLDAEGKVVSARALGATTAEMDAAVRSLVFQKLAADAPAEIEIALAAR